MAFSLPLLYTLRNRFQHYREREDAVTTPMLRPGQQGLAQSVLRFMRDGSTNSEGEEIRSRAYFVRPTGTGKTVSMVDCIIGCNTQPSGRMPWDQKTLVLVPFNFLLSQWQNEMLGEPDPQTGIRATSRWNAVEQRIGEEQVGVYRAEDPPALQAQALAKPVVLMTYDSCRSVFDPALPDNQKPAVCPEDFNLVMMDETHHRPRGDVTREFLQSTFYDKALIFGATATHLYRNGRTVGDYLFDHQLPIHETTIRQAINGREISPVRNVIVETNIDVSGIANDIGADGDYSEAQLESIIEQTGRDQAAIRLLRCGSEPRTGKKYRDMKQVWYCASIRHAERLAEQLNDAMGEDFAVAVHGQLDGAEQDAILINYRQGTGAKAIANCKLLEHAFDDPQAELCWQLCPTRSPITVLQQAGRVMRIDPNNPSKIANVISFVDRGIDQVLFGELAQGFPPRPEDFELPPTADRTSTAAETEDWPEIEGLTVHYTTRQLELFEERRRAQHGTGDLPAKPRDMYTVEAMAEHLFHHVDRERRMREIRRLQERVYGPLEEAYRQRQAHQQHIGLRDAEAGGAPLAIRGQWFPVSHVGEFRDKKSRRFCISVEVEEAIRYAMYGRVDGMPDDRIAESDAAQLLDIPAPQAAELIDRVKEAYLDRPDGLRNVTLMPEDGSAPVALPERWMGFATQRNRTDFTFRPDALVPLYQFAHHCDRNTAEQWYARQHSLQPLKTAQWLSRDDVLHELSIARIGDTRARFDGQWDNLQTLALRQNRSRDTSRETPVTPYGQAKRTAWRVPYQQAASEDAGILCLHQDELEWFKAAIGMESSYTGNDLPGRPGRRGRQGP